MKQLKKKHIGLYARVSTETQKMVTVFKVN